MSNCRAKDLERRQSLSQKTVPRRMMCSAFSTGQEQIDIIGIILKTLVPGFYCRNQNNLFTTVYRFIFLPTVSVSCIVCDSYSFSDNLFILCPGCDFSIFCLGMVRCPDLVAKGCAKIGEFYCEIMYVSQ